MAHVPKNDRTKPTGLIHRGGCVSGPYALWLERLDVESPEAVQARLDELGIDPVTDTIARAADEKYNRPENYEAYLCLSAPDARKVLDPHA